MTGVSDYPVGPSHGRGTGVTGELREARFSSRRLMEAGSAFAGGAFLGGSYFGIGGAVVGSLLGFAIVLISRDRRAAPRKGRVTAPNRA